MSYILVLKKILKKEFKPKSLKNFQQDYLHKYKIPFLWSLVFYVLGSTVHNFDHNLLFFFGGPV